MLYLPNHIEIIKNNCQLLADMYVTVTGENISFCNDILSVVGKQGDFEISLHTKDLFGEIYIKTPVDNPDVLLERFMIACRPPVFNPNSIAFDQMEDIVF